MSIPPELDRMRRSEESVQRVLEAGTATLAVTDQRLLALTPESDGGNFHAVERPNLEAVTTETAGQTTHLRRAVRPGILGVVLLGASQFVRLDGVAETTPQGTAQLGLGGLFALLEMFLGFLALLDTLLLVGGLGLLCLALLFVAAYGYSRSPELCVTVAGGDDLRVALEQSDSDARAEPPDPATVLNHALGSPQSTASEESPPAADPPTGPPTGRT